MDLTVSHNPWLLCALLWTLRVFGPGLAWSWIFSQQDPDNGMDWRQQIGDTALAAWLGLLINAVTFTLLAEFASATPTTEALILALVTIAGSVAGRQRIRILRRLPGVGLSFLIFCGIMLAPHRGEWIAGGWDPGIYVDQGVAVSRSGTFHPPADKLLSALNADELRVFTREVHNYTEYLPVVPIDPETRELQHFFFRLTPATIAIADRCGGLRAATRINLFLGWFALLGFGGLLTSMYRDTFRPAVAWILCAAHPIFIYMLHFPTSEMLQFTLVSGTLILLCRRTVIADAGAALGLLACMLNRFSFLPFAGLLLAAVAWRDLERNDRKTLWQGRAILVAAIAAGLLFDGFRCPVTVGRLDELVTALVAGGLGVIVFALLVDASPAWPFARKSLRRITPRGVLLLLLLVAGGAIAYDAILMGKGHIRTLYNVNRALPYLGVWFLGVAGCGFVVLCLRKRASERNTTAIILFLGVATVASFTVAAIAPLVPWALRRLIVFTLPLFAILCAEAVGWLWDQRAKRPPAGIAALLVVVFLLVSFSRLSWHAFSRTEFDGLSPALAEAAAHVPEGAIVVADHFRWSTPMHLLHGAHILNGEVLWQQAEPDRLQKALQTLTRLHHEGWTVVFMTSTDLGLGVYAGEIGPTREIWSSGPVEITDMVHRPENIGFPMRKRSKHFSLHSWNPPTPDG